MKVYISGPMTGRPKLNFPAFNRAEKQLLARGHFPMNPARHWGGHEDVPRSECMRLDIATLLHADAIFMLKGWENSRGARVEHEVARELGLQVIYEDAA